MGDCHRRADSNNHGERKCISADVKPWRCGWALYSIEHSVLEWWNFIVNDCELWFHAWMFTLQASAILWRAPQDCVGRLFHAVFQKAQRIFG